MVNVFGSTGDEESSGSIQAVRKVIAISGRYDDYFNEIQASHKLEYPAYRIAPEGSPTLLFTYDNGVYCLGAHGLGCNEGSNSRRCNENALPRILGSR